MSVSYRVQRFLVAVAASLIAASEVHAQCSCFPPFAGSLMNAPRTVSFHGNWTTDQKGMVVSAFQQWNTYWSNHGDNVEFFDIADNEEADITVSISDDLEDPNWDAQMTREGPGYGQMIFRPATVGSSNLWRHAIHEFGHALGLGDIYGCPDSAMSNPPHAFGVTICDYTKLNTAYRGDQSPILIDMTGGGIECSSAPNGVMFDIKATGAPVRVAWPTSSSVAFLVRDLNQNGFIDDSSEMFGNHTVMPDGEVAPDGYVALAALDDDHDDDIDASDAVFSQLLLWRDLNRDGVSQSGELQPVSSSSITHVYTIANYLNYIDQWANWYPFWSTVATSVPGVTLTSVDVFLKTVQPE